MEQRDYILREIEKIGLILNAIKDKIFGGNAGLAINIEKQVDDVKEMLLKDLDFELDKFLLTDFENSSNYLDNYDGFTVENIILLADCISQLGYRTKKENSKKYLEKALHLYELSNVKSKTYSFEKERKILEIKNALSL